MAVSASAVTVGTTATHLTPWTPPAGLVTNPSQSFAVRNNGSATVYLGGQGVTVAQGYPLAAGAELGMDLENNHGELYGIVATGTVEVRVIGTGL